MRRSSSLRDPPKKKKKHIPGVWPEKLRDVVQGGTFYEWPERVATPTAAADTFAKHNESTQRVRFMGTGGSTAAATTPAAAMLGSPSPTTLAHTPTPGPGDTFEMTATAPPRGVLATMWEYVKEETGFGEAALRQLVDGKSHDTYVAAEHGRLAWGDYSPQQVLDFARGASNVHKMDKAIAEIKRRLADYPKIAIRGVDLMNAVSEAELEGGIGGDDIKKGSSLAKQRKVADPETQRQLLKLKLLLSAHINENPKDKTQWTDKQTSAELKANVQEYLEVLQAYTDDLQYRRGFQHGVHDHNENVKHKLLRQKEAAARRRIAPKAIHASLQTLNLQKAGIEVMEPAIAPAGCFPNLTSLSLTGNAISIIENTPASLVALHVCGNGAVHVEPSGVPEKLMHLGVAYNRLMDFTGFTSAAALASLDASFNCIHTFSALDPLAALSNLKSLHLTGNPVALLPYYRQLVLWKLPKLQELDGRPVTPDEHQRLASDDALLKAFARQQKIENGEEVSEPDPEPPAPEPEPEPEPEPVKKGAKDAKKGKGKKDEPVEEEKPPEPEGLHPVGGFRVGVDFVAIKGLLPDEAKPEEPQATPRGGKGKPPPKGKGKAAEPTPSEPPPGAACGTFIYLKSRAPEMGSSAMYSTTAVHPMETLSPELAKATISAMQSHMQQSRRVSKVSGSVGVATRPITPNDAASTAAGGAAAEGEASPSPSAPTVPMGGSQPASRPTTAPAAGALNLTGTAAAYEYRTAEIQKAKAERASGDTPTVDLALNVKHLLEFAAPDADACDFLLRPWTLEVWECERKLPPAPSEAGSVAGDSRPTTAREPVESHSLVGITHLDMYPLINGGDAGDAAAVSAGVLNATTFETTLQVIPNENRGWERERKALRAQVADVAAAATALVAAVAAVPEDPAAEGEEGAGAGAETVDAQPAAPQAPAAEKTFPHMRPRPPQVPLMTLSIVLSLNPSLRFKPGLKEASPPGSA